MVDEEDRKQAERDRDHPEMYNERVDTEDDRPTKVDGGRYPWTIAPPERDDDSWLVVLTQSALTPKQVVTFANHLLFEYERWELDVHASSKL